VVKMVSFSGAGNSSVRHSDLLEGRAFIGIRFCSVSGAGISSVRGRESRGGSRVGSAGCQLGRHQFS
jgi:hypothetical protein